MTQIQGIGWKACFRDVCINLGSRFIGKLQRPKLGSRDGLVKAGMAFRHEFFVPQLQKVTPRQWGITLQVHDKSNNGRIQDRFGSDRKVTNGCHLLGRASYLYVSNVLLKIQKNYKTLQDPPFVEVYY